MIGYSTIPDKNNLQNDKFCVKVAILTYKGLNLGLKAEKQKPYR